MQTSSTRPLLVVLLLTWSACASAYSAPLEPSEPTGPLAPRPHTAGELRDALQVGTTMRFKVESPSEVNEEHWFVSAADATGCITNKVYDEAGALVEDLGADTASWDELRDHASFPATMTQRSDSHVETPAGSFDTWLYVVTGQGPEGKPMASRFEFAKNLPGPHLSMSVESQGQLVVRMTLIARSDGNSSYRLPLPLPN